MASSSSSPSAPALSSQIWKYHVFISFRGEDTRKTFVDHLYTALVQRGIYTYKDDETLLPGESINPSLMTAIEESQIAVIVFSKNYAESSWCLDELEFIMKCKDTRGKIVMPIFYNVDPSEVRKQKCKYGEAFVKHELENNNKVESWRKALVGASNISGWETQHIAHGHESKCIKKIVDTISHRLHPVTSSVDDNLVGVESRMHDLISKLQIGFGGKIMIGIWGVGGGGKTTLASSIYDEISSKFDGCCFVKNIREESSNKNGLEKLQAKILSGVLKQKQVEVGRVEEGRRIIKDRLHHRKVLIVLDDVDHPDHLEALAGSCDWFGEGSRVIITTRDEHVLTAHKVDLIHNISLLNNEEAMKLFCKHATRGYRPVGDYELLSKHVVSYAGGLPLALRVLGRFLCDKEMNEWRSALARLKEIPDANILEVLKISFDGLTPIEKELFLDIACFFKQGYWLNEVRMMILDACGFYPVIGVKVLIQKALITIWKGRVVMHDLVEEMAHYIVRGEHPKNPEKHSRVWKKEDVLKICAMDATTNFDRIEALSLECPESEEQLFVQTVANMKKLRWIDVNIKKSIVPYFTTSSITYIHHHPVLQTRPLPENFPPRELCCLTLNGVNQKQLWEGYKYLPNLKMISLARLWNLIKTPNFDGLPNLERFMIKESRLVQEIHPSFGHLEKLLYVAIEDCLSLKMLPPMTRSKNLETLILLGCKELFNSSKIQQNMENLEHLQQHFLPHNNVNRIGLRSLNRYLKKLDLSSCNLGDEFISSAAVWELPNLQELNLEENEFVRLNFSLLRLPRLKWLSVSFCDSLVELSEMPTSIAVVYADWCSSLESLGDISKCKWLWKVSLRWPNEVGLHVGDKILRSMLQGNAKDHFITINFPEIDIWRGFVPRLDFGMKFSMPLPHDCYTHFCGILMFIKSSNDIDDPHINIVIKQGLDEAFESELWQEYSYETLEDPAVGYISFSSLRHNGCFNSTYNMISFSLRDEGSFGAVLIPRTSKDDPMEKTDCSEFWDDEIGERKRFRIQHDSESSINIIWEP